MTSFEHFPAKSPGSEELIRDLLEGHEIEPLYIQDMIYSTIIGAMIEEGKSFDDIHARATELGLPVADTVEPAENYQPLIDELREGRLVKFQRSDGNFYSGIIDGEPKLHIDIARSEIVAMLQLPIEYEGETDYQIYCPRRSQETGDMILPGVELC